MPHGRGERSNKASLGRWEGGMTVSGSQYGEDGFL